MPLYRAGLKWKLQVKLDLLLFCCNNPVILRLNGKGAKYNIKYKRDQKGSKTIDKT